jgi:hypothetical protein
MPSDSSGDRTEFLKSKYQDLQLEVCQIRDIELSIAPNEFISLLVLPRIYRVFQNELYNFERFYTFVQRACTVF